MCTSWRRGIRLTICLITTAKVFWTWAVYLKGISVPIYVRKAVNGKSHNSIVFMKSVKSISTKLGSKGRLLFQVVFFITNYREKFRAQAICNFKLSLRILHFVFLRCFPITISRQSTVKLFFLKIYFEITFSKNFYRLIFISGAAAHSNVINGL